MAGQLNNFRFSRSMNVWSDKVTQKNHLGTMLVEAQNRGMGQRATDLMIRLMGFKCGKTLESFLAKYPTKELEDDRYLYWQVIGSSLRNEPLIEARDEEGNVVEATSGMIGAHTAPFYLVFATDIFHDGEFIVGNLNEQYQFRILEDPREEGSNFVYKVELAGGNEDGVPSERLLAGERFSVESAFVESGLSRKVGGINYASPTSMRNEWSTIRLDKKVSGDMLNSKLAIQLPVAEEKQGGKYSIKYVGTWMHYVDWQVEETFSRYKNHALGWGVSNQNEGGEYKNIGKSGNVIKTGNGLFKQMEFGYTHFYNDFSLKVLEEALYNILSNTEDFGNRNIVLCTGERGAALFNKAVMQEVSGWTMYAFNGDNLGVVKKTSADFTGSTQALAAGAQFTEFYAPMGIHLKLCVLPFYDDTVRNKIKHHLGGLASSYIFDIFDMGTQEHQNIFKCRIKGQSETRSYRWGFRNPFTGQFGNSNMSYDEDSASVTKFTQLGICILDPTRTMRILPSELAC